MSHKTLNIQPVPGLYVNIMHDGENFMFVFDLEWHQVVAIQSSENKEIPISSFPKEIQDEVIQKLCKEKEEVSGFCPSDFREQVVNSFRRRRTL